MRYMWMNYNDRSRCEVTSMIGLVAIIPKWTKFSGMFTLVKYYSLARYIGHIMETQWEYDGEYLSLSRDPMGTCFFFFPALTNNIH